MKTSETIDWPLELQRASRIARIEKGTLLSVGLPVTNTTMPLRICWVFLCQSVKRYLPKPRRKMALKTVPNFCRCPPCNSKSTGK